MKHFGKFVLVKLAFGGVVGVAARIMLGGTPPPVTCRPVHGTIHRLFTMQNCSSPVGLCTAGTITDAGLLDGCTTFTALAVAPSERRSHAGCAHASSLLASAPSR